MRTLRSLLIITPILTLGLFVTNSCNKKVVAIAPSPADVLPEKSFYAVLGSTEFVDTVLWAEEDGDIITITASENGENEYPKMIFKLPSDIVSGTYELGGAQSENQAFIQYGTLPDQQFESIDSTSVLFIYSHQTEVNLLRAKFVYTAKPTSENPSIPNIDVWSGDMVLTY